MTTSTFPSLVDLNRRSEILDIISTIVHPGLIIFSGSTGAGVSTTLAAVGGVLERDGYKVRSIRVGDDMAVLPGLNEIYHPVVGPGLVRTVLGVQQPDVVIIDDVRTPELAKFAVDLALKDALMVIGLHAPSAEEAVKHLVAYDPKEMTRAVTEVLIMSVHQSMEHAEEGENSEDHLRALSKAENLMSMANPTYPPFGFLENRKVVSTMLVTVPLTPWEPPKMDNFAATKKWEPSEEFLKSLEQYVVPGGAK